jgi:hypothetical protein
MKKNLNINLDYEPDMKDPRDFTYRIHDWSCNIIKSTQNNTYMNGIVGLIEYYIENQSDETNELYKQIKNEFKHFKKNCKLRYKSFTFRSIFSFLKTFIQANTLDTGKTELIYWRIPKIILDKTLEEIPILTGIPIFKDCLQKSVGNTWWDINIPNRDNHFIGYLPVILYSYKDTIYNALFVVDNNIKTLKIPKYLIHVCEPIFWTMKIIYKTFNIAKKKKILEHKKALLQKQKIQNNNKFYKYSFDSYEYYMKIGPSI